LIVEVEVHRARRSCRGFTLVELLVVVGMIAVLIGVLLPALARAREQSKAVSCASQLRQLYLAQMFYADDNGGRITPVLFEGINRTWHPLLAPYVTKVQDEQNFERTAQLFLCPSVDPGLFKPTASAYGMNSHVMLDNWRSRRDRKTNASEIILMGDKPMSTDDYLTSEDGHFLLRQESENKFWMRVWGHRSAGSYRHGGKQLANMVMLDGHVAALGRRDLRHESGHWFWGQHDLPTYDGTYCNCP
jgi:prepilin-type processing-associated H-X9-DG protein/prepilin-type N-terminal cleavage/methylation domain-containing protein